MRPWVPFRTHYKSEIVARGGDVRTQWADPGGLGVQGHFRLWVSSRTSV